MKTKLICAVTGILVFIILAEDWPVSTLDVALFLSLVVIGICVGLFAQWFRKVYK